jgi:uncharacterized protein (TIGR03000 family)
MSPRPSLYALGVIALASAPAFGQFVAPHYSFGRIGSQNLVRPPIYTLGYGAFDPNFVAPAFVPGVGYGYYPSYTGLRPSYWSLPGRYNAYPWSGAGVYTGGTSIYAFYAPTLWSGASLDCGLATPYGPYVACCGPYGYFGDGPSGYLFEATAYTGAYRKTLPARSATGSAPAHRAMLSVQAPSDAKVWVQGEEVQQTDGNRIVASPPLRPGEDYSYTVTAQWKVNGKTMEQSQKISVRAGERSGLLFISGNEVTVAGR